MTSPFVICFLSLPYIMALAMRAQISKMILDIVPGEDDDVDNVSGMSKVVL